MGIAIGAAELLFKVSKKINFKGNLLQIGNQDILFSHNQFLKILDKYKYKNIRLNKKNKIENKFFFETLKFNNVESLDVSKYENADIIADLNYPIKKKYYSKFDFIYDGGSLEHVFNISQALDNVSKMLKINGYAMHLSPCNNYIDHGFYSINPTLLKDFYTQNKFEILEMYLIKQRYDLSKNTSWDIYEYDEEKIKYYNRWNWGNNRMLIWIVVKKIKKLNKIIYPTQTKYLKLHNKAKKIKNDTNFKTYIKEKYPETFQMLKKVKFNLTKLNNRKDERFKHNPKPKFLFKC